MLITLLQTDIAASDTAENICRVEALVQQLPCTDLVVLPEMWNTGFVTSPEQCAESAERGAAFAYMRATSAALDAAVTGSIAVRTAEGEFRNRMYFVRPDGTFDYYDKHHLFTYGGETRSFARGERRVVVEWRGLRILLQICYDVRFPEWSRCRGDYDCAIYVASWPTTRRDAWSILTRARAVENLCYVAAVNRVGSDCYGSYDGGSTVISPYGTVMGECRTGEACGVTVELKRARIDSLREKFPALNDADAFKLL